MGLFDRILNIMHDSDMVEWRYPTGSITSLSTGQHHNLHSATVSAPTLSVTTPADHLPTDTAPTKEIAAAVGGTSS